MAVPPGPQRLPVADRLSVPGRGEVAEHAEGGGRGSQHPGSEPVSSQAPHDLQAVRVPSRPGQSGVPGGDHPPAGGRQDVLAPGPKRHRHRGAGRQRTGQQPGQGGQGGVGDGWRFGGDPGGLLAQRRAADAQVHGAHRPSPARCAQPSQPVKVLETTSLVAVRAPAWPHRAQRPCRAGCGVCGRPAAIHPAVITSTACLPLVPPARAGAQPAGLLSEQPWSGRGVA